MDIEGPSYNCLGVLCVAALLKLLFSAHNGECAWREWTSWGISSGSQEGVCRASTQQMVHTSKQSSWGCALLKRRRWKMLLWDHGRGIYLTFAFQIPPSDRGRLMWNSRSANKWGTSLCSCSICTVFSFRLLILKARWDYRVLISRYLPFSYPFSSGLESQFVQYLRFPGWLPALMCHFSTPAKLVLPGSLKWPAHL